MAIEIERKFLVTGDGWRFLSSGIVYRQGYIATEELKTVRIRVFGKEARLTIKGPTIGRTRAEFEYPIPLKDAEEMLNTLCKPTLIEKTRYKIPLHHLIWEIDEFHGANQGLILAEVELKSERQIVELPDWIGEEVSDDPRYFNSALAKHPYSQW
ncbi:MAG: CYTH domain-containing protein [Oscillatoria sp. SIO1A7]|nr:CYTH domain-containing protein [Oscillatoria sp. SIO1A7]